LAAKPAGCVPVQNGSIVDRALRIGWIDCRAARLLSAQPQPPGRPWWLSATRRFRRRQSESLLEITSLSSTACGPQAADKTDCNQRCSCQLITEASELV
jgi:hypothetical protein